MRTEAEDVLLFEAGGARFGVLAAEVQEICRAVTILPLPGAPAAIEGAINYRGRVIAVVDARTRFALPPRPLQLSDHLIILRAGGERLFALRVDAATAIERAVPIERSDRLLGETKISGGFARVGGRLTLIHDLHAFISGAELEALESSLRSEAR